MDASNKNAEYIKDLSEKIKAYQKSYYQGEGEISDEEFDKLWDELKTLDPDNPILKKVGSDLSDTAAPGGIFEKQKHIIPMGSQEKAASPEQFLEWAEKHKYNEYLVEYKLDGASLELQYQNGVFQRAVTRGDGETGDDITKNVLKMKGLVINLEENFTGGIRGEVIMSHEVHKKLYPDKANCRNAANGLMKRKDGSGSENLEIICYDAALAFSNVNDRPPFIDERAKVLWLKNKGFNTVPLEICKNPEEVIDYRIHVMEIRPSLNYDIDGLVIKNNEIDMADASRARPDKQIAFKFSLEEAITTVRNVIWNENGATYTPVAEFDTVELAGTKVSRASLANPNTIKALGLEIGSNVVVVKRGEIIPKIEAVIKDDFALTTPVSYPQKCSVCGSPLKNEGTRLFCPNLKCRKRIHHQLQKWINVIEIRDLGRVLIKDLFDSGDINSISDIYSLTEETLTKHFLQEKTIEQGEVSKGAQKVMASIKKSRRMTLEKFIAGFDIEGIGETMVEKLVEAGFTTLESFLAAKTEDFANVPGFADITAGILVEGLQENADEMKRLTEGSSPTITLETASAGGGKLEGLTFCFTGELFTMKRSEAEKRVKALGGSAKSSVVKGLSYLVTNDTTSGSAKNKKAAELGIPVIDEKAFLAML